jgi:hypothetical protein
MCYAFADCVLDPDAVTLTVDGSSVPAQPQVVDVLARLIDELERVERGDPRSRVGDRFVGASRLSTHRVGSPDDR